MARNEHVGSYQTPDAGKVSVRPRHAATADAPPLTLIHPPGLSGAARERVARMLANPPARQWVLLGPASRDARVRVGACYQQVL